MPITSKSRLVLFLMRPWLALIWLATLLACAGWIGASLVGGYNFDSNITALLPASHAEEEAERDLMAHVDGHLSRFAAQRMFFLVSHPQPSESAAAAAALAERLEQSGLFSELQGRIHQEQGGQWQQSFFPYRYALTTEADRAQLQSGSLGNEHPSVEKALSRLYSPMASALGATLLDDPLQTFFTWQLEAAPRTPLNTEDGWLSRRFEGRSYRLLLGTLAGDPYQLDFQAAVRSLLDDAQADLPADVELLSSGLLIHAAHGAEQARNEISTIGLGSLVGITLLLIYCFRRVRYLLMAFVPIACGWVFALAVSMALFDGLHLVTLAFGASLIGVAIDYALHYLCARQETGRQTDSLKTQKTVLFKSRAHAESRASAVSLADVLPAISLGLLSSVLAYAAQAAAPFPGLRQMAVFSVCGLLGAWLTVLVWLPHLAASCAKEAPVHRLADTFARMLARWPDIRRPGVAALVLLFVGLCLYQLGQTELDDDLRKLQTSPPELLAADARLQTLTRAVSPGQYFLVSAGSEQALLAQEERFRSKLDPLVNAGELYDYHAVSRWLPSLASQEQSVQLNTNRVFASGGLAEAFAARLGSPELADQMRSRFAITSGQRLDVATWLNTEVGRQQGHLWLGEFGGEYHSLIMLSGVGDRALTSLPELVQPGVRYVNKVDEITAILQDHRQQLQYWIVFAYAAVFLLLSWRYGLSAWRVVAAPAIASIASLAILSWLGLTLNIFSLLALLLVLGIGLDAGIFLRESARSRYTWTAVTLAACTTLLAFGLLALSKTPVLQQFGSTVVVGIVAVWCLAPCLIRSVEEPAPHPATTNPSHG
ncbi:MMPL family transporter [Gilvimarinus sp. F26214L]|uniref:MMPL family transporter n=1 Tax=Gilvimarinus sp. DZF01 TaxID=3461371 RepID=UPI00404611AD